MNPEIRARKVKNTIPPIVISWIVPSVVNQLTIPLKTLLTKLPLSPEISVEETPTRMATTIAVQTHLAPFQIPLAMTYNVRMITYSLLLFQRLSDGREASTSLYKGHVILATTLKHILEKNTKLRAGIQFLQVGRQYWL